MLHGPGARQSEIHVIHDAFNNYVSFMMYADLAANNVGRLVEMSNYDEIGLYFAEHCTTFWRLAHSACSNPFIECMI